MVKFYDFIDILFEFYIVLEHILPDNVCLSGPLNAHAKVVCESYCLTVL